MAQKSHELKKLKWLHNKTNATHCSFNINHPYEVDCSGERFVV